MLTVASLYALTALWLASAGIGFTLAGLYKGNRLGTSWRLKICGVRLDGGCAGDAEVAARLGVEPDYSPPDLTVKDHQSRSGVVLLGDCPAVEEFLRRLKDYAEPIVFTSPVGRHEVFVGRAVGGSAVEGPGGLLFDVPSRYVVEQGSVSVYTVLKPAFILSLYLSVDISCVSA
jgi:hypothetical protein